MGEDIMNINTDNKYNILFKKFFRWGVLILGTYYLTELDNINVTNAILVFISSMAPDIVAYLFKIKLSRTTDFIVQMFIFLSMFCGRMYDFYDIFPWWDLFLHFSSGIIIAMLAIPFIKLYFNEDIYMKISPSFKAIFVFIFSSAGAALWEVWEFSGDRLLGFDSQLNSLMDTMTDICMGTVSGFIIAIMVYFHYKKGIYKFIDDLKIYKINKTYIKDKEKK